MNVHYDNIQDLESVETLDEDGLSYAYNTLLVKKHTPTGRLYWAKDSGVFMPYAI